MGKKQKIENIIPDKKYIRKVQSRNKRQEEYIQAIREFPITIGVGAAGSGKSYLAISEATIDFDANNVARIILVRPAVPSEDIGYLPGTLEEKLDPHIRPLFDALIDRWAPEKVKKRIELGEIEIVSLGYCKGRTFTNCFVILDEAQDTTPEQMRLFLTRIGEYTTVVITGDPQQSEIKEKNGLQFAIEKLYNCPVVKIVKFEKEHIVRSDVVKKLMEYI